MTKMARRGANLLTALRNVRVTLEMIKIEHTLFALPFAFLGAVLAARGIPSIAQLFWITLAMVGARSAAMAFNRIADREYDARNPRTRTRDSRGLALCGICLGVHYCRGNAASGCRRNVESLDLDAGANCASKRRALLVYKALDFAFAHRAWLVSGDRANRSLDRGSWLARQLRAVVAFTGSASVDSWV